VYLRKINSSKEGFSSAGVNVMITIFGDFRQFFRKQLAFSLKTNDVIHVLVNLIEL
jgi:hypothetical protein